MDNPKLLETYGRKFGLDRHFAFSQTCPRSLDGMHVVTMYIDLQNVDAPKLRCILCHQFPRETTLTERRH